MKNLSIAFLVTFWFVTNAFAQQDTMSGDYKLKGIVKDQNSAVMMGVNLYFQKGEQNRTFATDINGKFEIGLQPGEYVITVNKANSSNFKAFIKIEANGLNPNNLEFILDPSRVCCFTQSGVPYPKPTSLPKPPYPAAARAVRARGEVVVDIRIGKDGKVISAKAESGHPLLRAASLVGARNSKFETSEQEVERESKLMYVFLGDADEKKGLIRYSNPYRIEIVSEAATIYD